MQHHPVKEKKIIGWREFIDLPEWGIRNIRAKIDTGARTSSLHVEDIRVLGNNQISFFVIVQIKNTLRRKKVVAERLKQGHVKSSTGDRTRRWYVKTKIRIGDFQRDIALNLVGREDMNFRMLLGRTALEEAFLVDVDRSFLVSKKRKVERT
jgi:hypothetical protein